MKYLKFVLLTLVFLLIAKAVFIASVSPAVISYPKPGHSHLRLQIVVNGQAVDFGQEQFQTQTPPGSSCNENITAEPMHFHDQKDQFLHLHWQGITGGLILKNYGWNLVGGLNNTLGYRLDSGLPQPVPIHGKVLPALPTGFKLWVYIGDKQGYIARSSPDFLRQGVEVFVAQKAAQTTNKLELLPKIAARGSEADMPQLMQLNDLLGNIVIFAQKDQPSGAQVKDRFEQLEPLSQTVCSS